MRLGAHASKCGDMNKQRLLAEAEGWTAVQTNFGSTQMYGIPPDVLQTRTEVDRSLFYSWHAPYTLTMNPKNSESAANFLHQIIRLAGKWSVDCVVVHTGESVGVPVQKLVDNVCEYIDSYSIVEGLERADTKIAIEFGASVCGTNINPYFLTAALESRYSDRIGYCLDLAHFPAAGAPYKGIRKLIKEIPPIVSHVNFLGAGFGSSLDCHGWRTTPSLAKRKKEYFLRTEEETELICREHDATLRLLASLDVPMVVEGSGFPNGNIHTEIEKIREIIS